MNHEEVALRLIFHERMSNETTVVVAKDTDVFLLLIYALEQLNCFLLPWCMAIDFNQFIKIEMIDDSWLAKYLMLFRSYMLPPFGTLHHTKFHIFKNVYNDSFKF